MFPPIPMPSLNFAGGAAMSSAALDIAPIYFGDYPNSRISDSGNLSPGVSGVSSLVWLAVIAGAYLLAKRGK